jgi:hypothetical protein
MISAEFFATAAEYWKVGKFLQEIIVSNFEILYYL